MHDQSIITEEFISFLSNRDFPCVAAKDALAKNNLRIIIADHMACPKDDNAILQFIYSFTENYRQNSKGFFSAVVIFKTPAELDELLFENLMAIRLRGLKNIDAKNYQHDPRVSADPLSADYSFSLMEEAFFIVGMHPQSSRPARRFKYPALVFNPHAQFQELKNNNRYEKLKTIVRRRDLAFSGSVNPMLTDFGTASEIFQYSGRNYDLAEKCPFNF
ncbi:MAG: guanitoxin biosynthesis heme-dependent pre-guanitoxin N-hydroxylase GntA [Ferruginibacter sp.]